MIVAAAQLQDCALLLTEDLQDSGVYGTVTARPQPAPAAWAAAARVTSNLNP
jgi:predicted nucleic acid-binding protein